MNLERNQPEFTRRPEVKRQHARTLSATDADRAVESVPPAGVTAPVPAVNDKSTLAERDTTVIAQAAAKSDTAREFPRIPLPTATAGATAGATAIGLARAAADASAPSSGSGENHLYAGPYRLLACIETGKSSQVWEAFSADGERRIAVKLLLPEALKKVEHRRVMREEFRVGKQFDHPNVIKFLDGHWGTLLRREAFYSMELFLAPSLKTQLVQDLAGVQQHVVQIVETAAEGFSHIHERGFLHLDIKPANLLVNKAGSVRIISFAHAARPTSLLGRLLGSRFRTAQGTRSYIAPEQILKKPLSFPVDVYSFGIVLYEMLTGQLPFSGSTPNELLMKHIKATPPNPSHLNRKVSVRLDRIVLRMLAKKPDQRYPSFGDFLADFQAVHPRG